MLKGLEEVLKKVEKPARYIGDEWNAVHKDHSRVDLKVALAFPDVYDVGMSHIGLKILYEILNNRPDVVAERVFAPWVDMESLMRRDGLHLFCLESGRPVKEFDIVGFTLQYEMSYTNILNMLDLAGIPLRSSQRGEGDPLVIAGGPCAFNPEPLADFLDAVLLGDGEEAILEIADAWKSWKASGSSRSELLKSLGRVEGVYVPSFYDVRYRDDGRVDSIVPLEGAPERVTRRVVDDLDAAYFPTRPVVPNIDIVHDRIALEVFRGCTRGCRFCSAGVIYRPVRERSEARAKELADELVRNTGYNEISLSSLSTADYSAVRSLTRQLVDRFEPEGVGVSLPSLRIDAFSVGLAEEVQRVRKTGLTFAPEAGTQRLRDVINKGVTEEDLLQAVTAAYRAGWDRIKLYFMIGLPTETDEDVLGIARLAREAALAYDEHSPSKRRKVQVNVSVSSFVPKAHTPFQWVGQVPLDELKRRQRLLGDNLKDRRLSYSWHDANLSFIEAVFSRGDRRLGRVLETAWRSGCRFDGWSDFFRFDTWMKAFADEGLDPSFYANREREPDEVFPWDHLDTGMSTEYLWSEYQNAIRGILTPDCREGCVNCEVCFSLGVAMDLRGDAR